MKFLRHRVRGGLFLLFIFGLGGISGAEDLTITTYYPSPRGVYDELRTSGNVGIGTTGAVSERLQVEGGSVYVVNGDLGIGTPPNFGGGALQLPFTGAIDFDGGGRITSSLSRIEIGASGLLHDLKVWGSEQIGGMLAFKDSAGNFEVEVRGGAPRTLTIGRAGLPNSLLVNTNTLFVNGVTGNVGIGTAAPTEKLEVNGHVRLSSDGAGSPTYRVVNSADPINPQDLTTKAYVDAKVGGGCYVSNTGFCLAGFTSEGSAGDWYICDLYWGGGYSQKGMIYLPPGNLNCGDLGGGGAMGTPIRGGTAVVCCK